VDLKKAGFPAGPPRCLGCEGEIRGEYYLAGQGLVCGDCGREILEGPERALSATLAGVRGAAFGLIAAALGAWGLHAWRGAAGAVGILPVLTAAAIGWAVRLGSAARGGWPFQTLAAVAVYLCVAGVLALEISDSVEDPARAALLALGLPFRGSSESFLLLATIACGAYLAARLNGRRSTRLPGPFRLGPVEGAASVRCPDCAAEAPPPLTACPACKRLLHGDEIARLLDAGRAADLDGDPSRALEAWRRALELLPPGSTQHAEALTEVRRLSDAVESRPARKRGVLAAVAAAVLFILSKGKFLLAGLTKAPTLFSMALTAGVYIQLWGWKFALGLVVSLYIHEMGHLWMMRRYGIRASAPMFIPGLGAFVRMHQYPATVREDARVGLAGPVWGLAAALAAAGLWKLGLSPFWGAVAKFGAWINLFNLLPVWQFDGGRGFRSLPRWQRGIAAAVLVAAGVATGDGLLYLLALAAAARTFWGEAPRERDDGVLIHYVLLVACLSLLAAVEVDIPAPEK
jgi:Zn-dependent protease